MGKEKKKGLLAGVKVLVALGPKAAQPVLQLVEEHGGKVANTVSACDIVLTWAGSRIVSEAREADKTCLKAAWLRSSVEASQRLPYEEWTLNGAGAGRRSRKQLLVSGEVDDTVLLVAKKSGAVLHSVTRLLERQHLTAVVVPEDGCSAGFAALAVATGVPVVGESYVYASLEGSLPDPKDHQLYKEGAERSCGPANPLEGVTVSFSGRPSTGGIGLEGYGLLVTRSGGRTAVDTRTADVIVAFSPYRFPATVPVVSPEWLLRSAEACEKLPLEDFLNQRPSQCSSTSGPPKRRQASTSEDEEESAETPKKKKKKPIAKKEKKKKESPKVKRAAAAKKKLRKEEEEEGCAGNASSGEDGKETEREKPSEADGGTTAAEPRNGKEGEEEPKKGAPQGEEEPPKSGAEGCQAQEEGPAVEEAAEIVQPALSDEDLDLYMDDGLSVDDTDYVV